jgi:putative ABC transport system permease protein
MTLLHRLASVTRWLLHRKQVEQQLDDELREFIEMSVADKVREGMPLAQARRIAILEFGGVEQTKERVRRSRPGALLDDVSRDLRYAVRMFAKHPAFTVIVVLTLALGIGATTVIFSTIDAVQHFIPIANRNGLVYAVSIDTRVIQRGSERRSVVLRGPVSVPDFADWIARSSTFEQFAGFVMGSANLTGIKPPLRISVIRVTPNLGELWGFRTVLGRGLSSSEGVAGAEPVTLLSYRFWQLQFSANPAVLGQRLRLDGVPHTIVGVLPPAAGTGLFRNVDLFTPLIVDPLRGERSERAVFVTGRLKPGVSREQASSDLARIARQLESEHPQTNQHIGALVAPLIEASGFNVRILLSLLGLIALLVLMVACANVVNIIVAQSLSRQHEFALRAALGASRLDRVRQLMMESALVSAAAGALGVVLAVWGVGVLRWLAGDSFGFADIRVNGRVVAVGLATAAAASFFCGIVPAIRLPIPGAQELGDIVRTSGAIGRGRRTRTIIVGVQAAAAMILMVQIALLVRTTWNLNRVPSGFDPSGVITFRASLSGQRYAQAPAIERFTSDLIARLRTAPGVASVGIVDRLPVADSESMVRLTVEGAPPVPLETRPLVARSAVSGDYFAAMRIPVVQGRAFSTGEMSSVAAVALINVEAARRFWPGRDPLGARIALDAAAGQERWLQIVGVVGNLRNSDVDQGPLPQVYVSLSWQPTGDIAVVVKSAGENPLQLVPAIRMQVTQIDSDQPIHDVVTMRKVLFDDLASTYVLTALLSVIGFIALCLSAAGIYGIVSYSVAQRWREIGVRMALGAQPGRIVRMVVAHAAKPVAVGSLLGFVVAVFVAFAIASGVPEFEARDPVNYAGVVATISLVAFAASYLPARRAASVNPLDSLRQQ